MDDTKNISVVINTYNAEKHLEEVLESVKNFDEVLICDMESTDRTVEIAQKHGCRIVTFKRLNYTIVEYAREFAIHKSSNKWVLVVDADEIVTPQLQSYLYQCIEQPDCPEGIAIPRKNYFMGNFMHSAYPDYVLRFFQRDKTHWPPVIHCSPRIEGKVIRIPSKCKELALVHLANDSVSDVVSKTNVYTDNELSRRQHKRYGVFALLFRPLFRFFKSYILKRGFLDGAPGLIHALLDGYYQFILVAKMMEKQK